MSAELEAVILDQMETIDKLVASLSAERANPYWESVYDNIRDAFEEFAMAELGTARPSHLDLEGRPELKRLWESVR